MKILFNEHSALCKSIRTTVSYWKYIVEVKHPESFRRIGFEKSAELVRGVLRNPDVVVRERVDPSVNLYYKHLQRQILYLCGRQTLKWRWVHYYSVHYGSHQKR